jgi:hypothetical protein
MASPIVTLGPVEGQSMQLVIRSSLIFAASEIVQHN